MRYRHTCHLCRQHVALAGLEEVAPALFECITCRADQRARDAARDAQVNALKGAPIDEDTRRLLGTWRLMKGSAA
ncbi:hypothetical protein [Cellulomonas sp. KH9]|uniref:hypothetical protein n=1 Tax=Cellulomonas sp. KH9 TaxID=1855324 RepID=UPI0008E34886|nr:hypothetical protein [Cellulomonas sp. KH9]SFK32244.1 hypothetical protein SAMN05216467_2882 [Cellulomonas sp. KH9]